MVNKVVLLEELEATVLDWCAIMQKRSPLALRMVKRCLNAELDGQHGLMQLAGDATLMYYLMDEAQEGKHAFWRNEIQTLSNILNSPKSKQCHLLMMSN